MGLFTFLEGVVNGYQAGRALVDVSNILSKDGADQCSEIYHCITSSSQGELDKVEQMLLHATSNGLTQTVRDRAADAYTTFREMRHG